MSELVIRVNDIEAQIVEKTGLEIKDAKDLLTAYGMPLTEAGELLAEAETLEVTAEDQTDKMARAREIRLQLQKIRIATKAKHDEIKEDVKKRGDAIDFVERTVRGFIEPAEAKLKEAEKFAEYAEQARKDARTKERLAIIAQYTDNVGIYNVEDLADDAFALIVDDLKAAHAARAAAEAKRVEDEKAAELARQAEQEKQRKLRLAAEKKLAAERAERKAADEKAARAQAEADALKKAEQDRIAAEEAKKATDAAAEAKRVADEKAAAEKAAAAPDKEKLLAWISEFEMVVPGDLTTDAGKAVAQRIATHLDESTKTYRKLIESEL